MKLRASLIALLVAAAPLPAHAWGYQGHRIVAALARSYLTPQVKAKIDALLAEDTDTLVPHDMLSAATWADTWRNTHRETSEWHFVDLEIDKPDLAAACFGHPPALVPASAGPEKSCLTDRLTAFTAELNDPATPKAERILALKYVLHFMGDIHQPLHAADHEDHGGNCVLLDLGDPMPTTLHSYWDSRVIGKMGEPWFLTGEVKRSITPTLKAGWQAGDAASWAMESYAIAKSTVYSLPAKAGCDEPGTTTPTAPITLPAGYEAAARGAITTQLGRAGVRLAYVLNRAFR
jgi:hypothetical protein